jgi:hypothetical protein
MCRALRVLCVAPDEPSLDALRSAAVSAEWELVPGATDESRALDLLDTERPHVLVVVGGFDGLVAATRRRYPGIRIVADRPIPGVAAVAGSLEEVRGLVLGLPRPGGPAGAPVRRSPRRPNRTGGPSGSRR